MKDIMDALDDYLTDILENESPDKTFLFYGLSELVTKDKDVFPATINGRTRVAVNDRYEVITHHRIVNTESEEDEDYSFGLNTTTRYRVTIRTVLCHKITVGEDYRYTFNELFPDKLTVPGYLVVFLVPNGIDEDHERVQNEEWPETNPLVYGKHRLPWNICAINTIVEFVKC